MQYTNCFTNATFHNKQTPTAKRQAGWVAVHKPCEINLRANHDKSGWYVAGQTACYCLDQKFSALFFLFASCF